MKKITLLLLHLVSLAALCHAQTIKIGKQTWSIRNLDVDHFRNGDSIPEAKTNEEWDKAGENKQPAWCYYSNDVANAKQYGKLYNWYAVNDPRGLAPQGWHIPSDTEWTILIDYLGGEKVAGKKMKHTEGWKDQGNGTNISGFSGLPGGGRDGGGPFNVFEPYSYGAWWSVTEFQAFVPNIAWSRYISVDSDFVIKYRGLKQNGLSVRCIKN